MKTTKKDLNPHEDVSIPLLVSVSLYTWKHADTTKYTDMSFFFKCSGNSVGFLERFTTTGVEAVMQREDEDGKPGNVS